MTHSQTPFFATEIPADSCTIWALVVSPQTDRSQRERCAQSANAINKLSLGSLLRCCVVDPENNPQLDAYVQWACSQMGVGQGYPAVLFLFATGEPIVGGIGLEPLAVESLAREVAQAALADEDLLKALASKNAIRVRASDPLLQQHAVNSSVPVQDLWSLEQLVSGFEMSADLSTGQFGKGPVFFPDAAPVRALLWTKTHHSAALAFVEAVLRSPQWDVVQGGVFAWWNPNSPAEGLHKRLVDQAQWLELLAEVDAVTESDFVRRCMRQLVSTTTDRFFLPQGFWRSSVSLDGVLRRSNDLFNHDNPQVRFSAQQFFGLSEKSSRPKLVRSVEEISLSSGASQADLVLALEQVIRDWAAHRRVVEQGEIANVVSSCEWARALMKFAKRQPGRLEDVRLWVEPLVTWVAEHAGKAQSVRDQAAAYRVLAVWELLGLGRQSFSTARELLLNRITTWMLNPSAEIGGAATLPWTQRFQLLDWHGPSTEALVLHAMCDAKELSEVKINKTQLNDWMKHAPRVAAAKALGLRASGWWLAAERASVF